MTHRGTSAVLLLVLLLLGGFDPPALVRDHHAFGEEWGKVVSIDGARVERILASARSNHGDPW